MFKQFLEERINILINLNRAIELQTILVKMIVNFFFSSNIMINSEENISEDM